MGLTPQLTATLLCLLACTSNATCGWDRRVLKEIIEALNTLSGIKTPCTQLIVADVFAAHKNTTEKEILCGATTVLRQIYHHHHLTQCLSKHKELTVLRLLQGLYRNFHKILQWKNCPVNEAPQRSLEHFVENLQRIMQKKYLQCGSSIF